MSTLESQLKKELSNNESKNKLISLTGKVFLALTGNAMKTK